VHLHRGVRGRGGGGEELGYVRLLAAQLVVRSPVDPPGCSPDDQFRGSEPGMSSGERERDALVSAARTTEDHPSRRSADGAAQCCLPDAERFGSVEDAQAYSADHRVGSGPTALGPEAAAQRVLSDRAS